MVKKNRFRVPAALMLDYTFDCTLFKLDIYIFHMYMYFIYIHTKISRLTYTNTYIHAYTKTLVKSTKKTLKKKER